MGKSDYVDFSKTKGQIFVKFSRSILGLDLIRWCKFKKYNWPVLG